MKKMKLNLCNDKMYNKYKLNKSEPSYLFAGNRLLLYFFFNK